MKLDLKCVSCKFFLSRTFTLYCMWCYLAGQARAGGCCVSLETQTNNPFTLTRLSGWLLLQATSERYSKVFRVQI